MSPDPYVDHCKNFVLNELNKFSGIPYSVLSDPAPDPERHIIRSDPDLDLVPKWAGIANNATGRLKITGKNDEPTCGRGRAH